MKSNASRKAAKEKYPELKLVGVFFLNTVYVSANAVLVNWSAYIHVYM